MPTLLRGGSLILPDRVVEEGALLVDDAGRIAATGPAAEMASSGAVEIPLDGRLVAPGYVDLHCHGGDGADFMDATDQAFRTVLTAHLRHGTTTLAPTTTVAFHEQILAALEVCARAAAGGGFARAAAAAGLFAGGEGAGSRVAGAHFYGPYFGPGAHGCHPAAPLRPPEPAEYEAYLAFGGLPEGGAIACATVAPEVPGAEAFARAARRRGIRLHAGHSNATLLLDELSTEVIADGVHLDAGLLRLAYKLKGPDRLALVTDCNRALDRPDGEYRFGPAAGGEPFLRRGGVCVPPDGGGPASSCQGMDHMVRTFRELTGAPLPEVVRMASLTPARVLGIDARVGSLEAGKTADLLVLDEGLRVERVFLQGREIHGWRSRPADPPGPRRLPPGGGGSGHPTAVCGGSFPS